MTNFVYSSKDGLVYKALPFTKSIYDGQPAKALMQHSLCSAWVWASPGAHRKLNVLRKHNVLAFLNKQRKKKGQTNCLGMSCELQGALAPHCRPSDQNKRTIFYETSRRARQKQINSTTAVTLYHANQPQRLTS